MKKLSLLLIIFTAVMGVVFTGCFGDDVKKYDIDFTVSGTNADVSADINDPDTIYVILTEDTDCATAIPDYFDSATIITGGTADLLITGVPAGTYTLCSFIDTNLPLVADANNPAPSNEGGVADHVFSVSTFVVPDDINTTVVDLYLSDFAK